MKIIGFNFTKISSHRPTVLTAKPTINTNIEFLSIEKEKLDVIKDSETIKVDFQYSLTYGQGSGKKAKKEAEILFEGNIILAASKDETKEVLKLWKKKEVSPAFKITLFNVILKRCSVKALSLAEELALPPHIPLPQLRPTKDQK